MTRPRFLAISRTSAAAWLSILLLAAPPAVRAQQAVRWETDIEKAGKLSREQKKPLLIDFSADWCGPCRLMEKETFPSPAVQELLRRVIPVRLDIDRDPPLARVYQVESIPRILLLPPGGAEPKMDLLGFQDARGFAKELRDALGMAGPREAIPPEARAAEADPVRAALAARTFEQLKRADPAAAAAGLDRLVAGLGVQKEAELPPLVDLLRRAGEDAVPALLRGMAHRHLAIRTASHRVLLQLLRERRLTPKLDFDPWAGPAARKTALGRWHTWYGSLATRRRGENP